MGPIGAKRKATNIWGKHSMVKTVKRAKTGEIVFRVGYVDSTIFPLFIVAGEGASWEAAFADAKGKRA